MERIVDRRERRQTPPQPTEASGCLEMASKGADGQPTEQYGGSLFEQAVLLICDALAMLLQRKLGISDDQMSERHTNLE